MSIEFKGGFRPQGTLGDSGAVGRVINIRCGTDAIYNGDVVALSSGLVSPLATDAATAIAGVAIGFFWIDPVTKEPVESQYKPASQTSGAGEYGGVTFSSAIGLQPVAKVIVDPEMLYAVKAAETIGVDNVGASVAYVDAEGTASKIDGRSAATVSITTVSANQDIGTIVDVFRAEGNPSYGDSATAPVNNWEEGNTVVLVKLKSSAFAWNERV